MFDELFGNEDEGDFGVQETSQSAAVAAQVQVFSYDKRPAHCASDLDLPSQPRQESNLVGLYN